MAVVAAAAACFANLLIAHGLTPWAIREKYSFNHPSGVSLGTWISPRGFFEMFVESKLC